ncbi:MAG: metal-sensitive transcriptional regulator [Dehalococcoidia bacterium]
MIHVSVREGPLKFGSWWDRARAETTFARPGAGGLMDQETQQDVLRRLAYAEGHLAGIRRMIEQDTYCVDVLKQTFAVRRAIVKLEQKMLEGHLHHCVVEGVERGDVRVLDELAELYALANR